MTPIKCVLGVSGVCWVGFRDPTRLLVFYLAVVRVLCWVCWVSLHVRAWAPAFQYWAVGLYSYARTYKPNTPDAPQSVYLKALNLKGFICVGCVSGWQFLVLGWKVDGRAGR